MLILSIKLTIWLFNLYQWEELITMSLVRINLGEPDLIKLVNYGVNKPVISKNFKSYKKPIMYLFIDHFDNMFSYILYLNKYDQNLNMIKFHHSLTIT
jgi:hypothetical protein